MKNSHRVFLKLFAFLFLTFPLISGGRKAFAEDAQTGEQKPKPVEVNAAQQRHLEETKETKPVPEIREKKIRMPEIPKRIARAHLGPAEQARLAELERKRAAGEITETEYDLEKDTLGRESNLQF